MSLSSLLDNDSVTVQRATTTPDAAGGAVRSWSNLFINVAARVEDLSASGRLRFMQYDQNISHNVTCQQDGILEGDRIITSDNRTLLVVPGGVVKVRGIGTIDDYYEVNCMEYRQ
jgi:hypothetical protein